MTQSKTLFAITALVGVALTAIGVVAAPFNASASAAAGQPRVDVVAERIGAAFASIDAAATEPANSAAPVRAQKGDLQIAPGCDGQTWPNIGPNCLSTANGAPAAKVRFVTIGSQSGDAETVLLRVPAAQIASR